MSNNLGKADPVTNLQAKAPRHHWRCEATYTQYEDVGPCDCGLDDLLAVADAAKEWVDYQANEKSGLFRDGVPGDLMGALERLEARR